MRKLLPLLVFAALIIAPWSAHTQSTESLVEKFTPLAGGDTSKMVNGLRTGQDFQVGTVNFETPTKKMGNGEVNIALSLAEANLKGVANPTPQQLKDALSPILSQRAEGKGWGEIANSMGLKLGDVVRSDRAQGRDRMARSERPERNNRPERPERAEKPDRPGR
jgi:hypothetical protein